MVSSDERFFKLTVQIVSAYFRRNVVPKDMLLSVIGETRAALALGGITAPPMQRHQPAVPIKKSAPPEYLVCFEDGRKISSVRERLQSNHGFSPAQYRAKWNLHCRLPDGCANNSKARLQALK